MLDGIIKQGEVNMKANLIIIMFCTIGLILINLGDDNGYN